MTPTTGIAKFKSLVLRRGSLARKASSSSKVHGGGRAPGGEEGAEVTNARKSGETKEDPGCWVPHPRSGIYVPRGHERIMDDVPSTAASFTHTYWLRNVDGVDRPCPDNYCYDLNTSKHQTYN